MRIDPCFPDDLPHVLCYRVGCVVLYALPRTPVEYVSSTGATTAAIVHPQIPFGADAWRLLSETLWKPLAILPPHWMPFLQRPRPSRMDPRPALKGAA